MRINWFLDRRGKHCPKRADGEKGSEAELGFLIFFLSFCLCWLFFPAFSSYSERITLHAKCAQAAHGAALSLQSTRLGCPVFEVVAHGL